MNTEPPGVKEVDAEPLKVKEPKVTRISRRVVYAVAVAALSVFAFSMITTFSPKKKVQGEERRPVATEKNQLPEPPDPIVSSPRNYQELHRAKRSNAVPEEAPGVLIKPMEPGREPADIAVPATVADEEARAKEQAEKDAVAAMTSGVGFEVRDPAQARSEQPVKPDFLLPGHVPARSQSADVTGAEGIRADDQNMQDEKRNFTAPREAEFPYLKGKLQSPISPFELKAGSILPAVLITGINSDLPGQLVAQIRESVYDTVSGNHLLIPQGTRLIGVYDSKIAFGQERVLVVWTRLIMPNGDSLNLEGMPGADLSGYAGVSGKVNNHYGKLIAGVVLGSIIGAGAQVATGGQGAPNVPPSFEQLAVSGAAQNINQAGQQITQKNLSRQPTIEISPGDKINVFVTKDMVLTPFTE